jgi:hypothetical protein
MDVASVNNALVEDLVTLRMRPREVEVCSEVKCIKKDVESVKRAASCRKETCVSMVSRTEAARTEKQFLPSKSRIVQVQLDGTFYECSVMRSRSKCSRCIVLLA